MYVHLFDSPQIGMNYLLFTSVRIKHTPIREGFIVELTIGMPTRDPSNPPRRHLDLDSISRNILVV